MPMKVVPFRLISGDDFQALGAWMGEQREQAGCVINVIGSLSVAELRFAGAAAATAIRGELEIYSFSGTISPNGAHLHIAFSDNSGAVIGGHLCAGSLVRTTAELVVACCLTGGSAWSWIRPPAMANCGSLHVLPAEGRQTPLHLQKHQPGLASADAAGPFVAQQLHDRHHAVNSAQAS